MVSEEIKFKGMPTSCEEPLLPSTSARVLGAELSSDLSMDRTGNFQPLPHREN